MMRQTWTILTLFTLLGACKNKPADPQPNLPQIHLYADSISWTEKRPVSVDYISVNDIKHLSGSAKYRGGSSSKYWKHSYALKLSDSYPLAGLPSGKAFVLNASYIDKTLMRHRFSFDLFRAMNSNNIAPLCRYAELYENNNYQGIYVIMERINAGRLNLKEKEGSALWKEPLIFYADMPMPQDTSNRHQQKYPAASRINYDDDMMALRDFLFNSSDDVFSTNVFRMFERQNVIDWQLILLLSNNSDGQLKNMYVYREGTNHPYKFAIWDYDHSFGRDGDGEYNMLYNIIDENRNILYARLNQLNPQEFNDALAHRYRYLRGNGAFAVDSLHQMLNTYHQELVQHIERNIERWPHNADWYHDNHTFHQEVTTIYDYLNKRLPQLDKRFGYNQ